MSNIEPIFQGELQFRRYSDTSTQGQQIVLQVEDREALRPFIGMEGKRFMAVFVLIGDDETPQPPPSETKKRGWSELGPKAAWLVKRCKEPDFMAWACQGGIVSEANAAAWTRQACAVKSRTQIDGNAAAEHLFETYIRKPWMKVLAQRGQVGKAMTRQHETTTPEKTQ